MAKKQSTKQSTKQGNFAREIVNLRDRLNALPRKAKNNDRIITDDLRLEAMELFEKWVAAGNGVNSFGREIGITNGMLHRWRTKFGTVTSRRDKSVMKPQSEPVEDAEAWLQRALDNSRNLLEPKSDAPADGIPEVDVVTESQPKDFWGRPWGNTNEDTVDRAPSLLDVLDKLALEPKPELDPPAATPTITATLPSGLKVEGLTLQELVELERELGKGGE